MKWFPRSNLKDRLGNYCCSILVARCPFQGKSTMWLKPKKFVSGNSARIPLLPIPGAHAPLGHRIRSCHARHFLIECVKGTQPKTNQIEIHVPIHSQNEITIEALDSSGRWDKILQHDSEVEERAITRITPPLHTDACGRVCYHHSRGLYLLASTGGILGLHVSPEPRDAADL